MKALLIISFTLLILGPRLAWTHSGWHTNAKTARQLLLKGICESLGLECPETSSLNCMSQESSALDLENIYELSKSVATRPKEEARRGVEFLLARGKELLDQIPRSEIECDRDSEEGKLINQKLGFKTWSPECFEAVIGFMSQFPELTWHYKLAEYQMFENNDFEAVGAVMGLAWYQVSQWHHRSSNWLSNAKYARQLLLKGMCESLGLECPETSALNCMSEQSSLFDLQSLYELSKSVATRSKDDGAKHGAEFLLAKRKELFNHIPQSEIECDRDSEEGKLINQKLGLNTWSGEWFQAMIAFMNGLPKSAWHYKASEYQMFEKNDLEAVGVVLGLDWYHVAQWYEERSGKENLAQEDL